MKRATVLEAAQLVMRTALPLLVVIGCTGKNSNTEPPGRGSPACQLWQDALCNYASKCQTEDASSCETQAKGVVCKSDDAATACTTKLNAATCTAPPTGCDLVDIADPTAAVTPCNDYVTATCDAEVRCQIEQNEATCVADAQIDCSTVYSVGLSYDTCLLDLPTASCTDLKNGTLPTTCTGVLVVPPAPQN